MTQSTHKRPKIVIWAVAFGLVSASLPVVGQEALNGPTQGFGIRQKFGATDNIRLEPSSVGTTYFSDTTLSYGARTENGSNSLEFYAEGVARFVNDPIVGTDSGFRDPRVDLTYLNEAANSRFSLIANYFKPDLAFQDPLTGGNPSDQDFYRGGGTREDFYGGVSLELGTQSPLGFVIDLNSRARSYSDTTDPLLFSNETHYAAIGAIFRTSKVTQGRIDWSEERYRAENASGTDRDTSRFTFGLDHSFSTNDSLSIDLGHSIVTETFDALPGVENVFKGPVASLVFRRLTPNGSASALLDTTLTSRGRQNTLEFGRVMALSNGALEFTLGAAAGDSFDPRPIGSIAYNTAPSARSTFNTRLARTASISDILDQATETTRFDVGYRHELTNASAISFDMYYADISQAGIASAGAGRERGSLYLSYSHSVSKAWDITVGYEHKYFNPDSGSAANSDGVFFALQPRLNMFK